MCPNENEPAMNLPLPGSIQFHLILSYLSPNNDFLKIASFLSYRIRLAGRSTTASPGRLPSIPLR